MTAFVNPNASPVHSPGSRWIVERQDGVVFVRSSTAGQPMPADWKKRLADFLKLTAGVGCVGAKRLTADSSHVYAMGEFIIHPKGFHLHGAGVNSHCYRFPEEVDAIAGGVMAVDAVAFDKIDGAALLTGELGAAQTGLALRRAGYRCVAIPQVVVNDANPPRPTESEAQAFTQRWGFDWRCPDMDVVRKLHGGTGLMWNVRFHAGAMPFDRYEYRPAPVWDSYAKADYFRQRAEVLASQSVRIAGGGNILELGCGDGLFTHLIALKGATITGIDPEHLGIAQAREKTATQNYPAQRPEYLVGEGGSLPFADGSFAAVSMFDVIEHLDNPVRVLREIARVLKPGGQALIVTPTWQYGAWSDPMYHAAEYTMQELVNQVSCTPGLKVVNTGTIGGVYRDAMVFAQKA